MNGNFTTYSGIEFAPTNIQVDNINIKDIAHSLSRICRFNGHIEGFYSVAQHSIKVSERLKDLGYDERVQLCGLLHDAAEAYLGDIPTPVKKYLCEYSVLELKYQNVIFEHFHLLSMWNSVYSLIKKIDTNILLEEWKFLNEKNVEKNQTMLNSTDFDRIEKDYLNTYDVLYNPITSA